MWETLRTWASAHRLPLTSGDGVRFITDNDRLKNVLMRAHDAAIQQAGPFDVGDTPLHLRFGLLIEGEGVAIRTFSVLDVDLYMDLDLIHQRFTLASLDASGIAHQFGHGDVNQPVSFEPLRPAGATVRAAGPGALAVHTAKRPKCRR